MNRAAFYAALRRRSSGVFGTSISQRQVRGIEGILDAFATHGDGRTKTLAYALATAYHETARRMVPVRETLAKDDATARRRLRKARYAQPEPPYRHCYYGRGQVQLTWKHNYERSGKDAGVNLVKYPDKALDPVIGARILIRGLLDGRWNGKGFGIAHYLPDGGEDDLRNARRTVNITDKWELIAGYYKSFLAAIKEAGGVPKSALDPVPAPKPKPKQTERQKQKADAKPPKDANPASPASSGGLLAVLIKLLTSIFGGKS
ncbi:glycoside hydrolase family 19 protein [Hoeflea sp. TYP-13]|uniref:glycoside hydrolase family 19 protein n=1 Tax=Hoeflea sp. TYP-13 TaxID=3230023 RepID=UPI0034C636DA